MAVATGLAYPIVSSVYLQEAFDFEPGRYTLPVDNLPKILQEFIIVDVFVVFAWTAEFSVKVSLLLFFRSLVNRLPPLISYVKIVIVTTIVVWAVLICEICITCPHFGLSVLSKSSHSFAIIDYVSREY